MEASHVGAGDTLVPPLSAEEITLIRDKVVAKRPAWKDYPFYVSVLAFAVSLVTSAASIYTSRQRDINDRKSQLTSAIQAIQDLNLKQVEVYDKYKGTPYESQAGGLINAQLNNMLSIAKDLAVGLGTEASTAALTVVGQGLVGNGDYVGAQNIFTAGLAAARSANDESVSLRNLAYIKMRIVRTPSAIQEGEQYLLQASNLERKYPLTELPGTIAWLKASAKLHWASLVAAENCGEAKNKLAEAEAALAVPVQNIDIDQLRRAIQYQAANGIGGVATCRIAGAAASAEAAPARP